MARHWPLGVTESLPETVKLADITFAWDQMSDHFSIKAIAPVSAPNARQDALRESATALEQSFLAEMLRHAGVARPPEFGGGGAGEDAFAGFLADAYAEELTRAGGIGLADHIFQALLKGNGE